MPIREIPGNRNRPRPAVDGEKGRKGTGDGCPMEIRPERHVRRQFATGLPVRFHRFGGELRPALGEPQIASAVGQCRDVIVRLAESGSVGEADPKPWLHADCRGVARDEQLWRRMPGDDHHVLEGRR